VKQSKTNTATSMHIPTHLRFLFPAIVAAAALQPALSSAQMPQYSSPAGSWRYAASIYAYIPSVGGTTDTRTPGGGNIVIDHGKLFDDSLKTAFMGAFEAHNGRWGLVTDYMYLSGGKGRQAGSDFTIGRVPVSASANFDWNLKGSIWTLAGLYRLSGEPGMTLDALGGVRMLDIQTGLRWSFTGDIGNLPPLERSGSSDGGDTYWDAIIGVKGRYALGASRWSVPFFADVGGGQSKLTYQAAAGISYGFSWGELTGMWRYISYETKSGVPLQDLTFNGPMIGATIRF
jgi:hypothetical protein